MLGGHKRKADVGLKVGHKGTKAVGKSGKKNHVLSLKDTKELAEADANNHKNHQLELSRA